MQNQDLSHDGHVDLSNDELLPGSGRRDKQVTRRRIWLIFVLAYVTSFGALMLASQVIHNSVELRWSAALVATIVLQVGAVWLYCGESKRLSRRRRALVWGVVSALCAFLTWGLLVFGSLLYMGYSGSFYVGPY